MPYDYYKLVPKEYRANLAFREEAIRIGSASKKGAQELWIMCARDLLFYVNTFCYVYEPRLSRVLPFNTYDYQDEAFATVIDCVGDEDLVVEKSRDMGVSWIVLTAFEWLWHFSPLMHTFLLLSRKEPLVEKKGDPKALFFKVDFIREHQPGWLLPRYERQKLHYRNADTGSTIDGDSTHEFAGVADRRTAIMLDEFSKMENQETIFRGTRDATDSRFFVFTPEGAVNMAYKVAHDSNFRKLTLHWSQRPGKNAGLYRTDGTNVQIIDQDYWNRTNRRDTYSFITRKPDNERFDFRSPWYDKQEGRAIHSKEIAQELDIDYLGSEYAFFDAGIINRLVDNSKKPYRRGELEWTQDGRPAAMGFTEVEKGRLLLWSYPGGDGHLARDRTYAVGVDISSGTGASDSAVVGIDMKTGEQVLEYANPNIRPEELARLVVAICRWLEGAGGDGARLIWEAPGPGRAFGAQVRELGYGNIYYKEASRPTLSPGRPMIPGYWPTKDENREVMDRFRRAITEGLLVIRSEDLLQECRFFVYMPSGWIQHRAKEATVDPSGARENHGDRVVAAALAWRLVSITATPVTSSPIIEEGTMAYKIEQAAREREEASLW